MSADKPRTAAAAPDLGPYAGRWVALVAGQVCGVGLTAQAAREAVQAARPREKFTLRFVETEGGRPLTLSPLMARIEPALTGLDQPLYLVGGAVRDALLGRVSHDLDFVVPATAARVAYRLGDALKAPAYVLDRQRDTGRVVLRDAGTTIDVARFRGPDLEADLRGRDFTINAMALPATARRTASLIDPCGGQVDLAARLLRQTDPDALSRDPVRTLRALRLAQSLDLTIDEATARSIRAAAPLLQTVAAERIRDEWSRLLLLPRPDDALGALADYGLLPVVAPAVADLATLAAPPSRGGTALTHTQRVLGWLAAIEARFLVVDLTADPGAAAGAATGAATGAAEPVLASIWQTLAPWADPVRQYLLRPVAGGVDGRLLLRLGALVHDLGRIEAPLAGGPAPAEPERRGAALAERLLRRLRYSREAVSHVRRIVMGRAALSSLPPAEALTGRAAVRFFRRLGPAGLDVTLLALAEAAALDEGQAKAGHSARRLALVARLWERYFASVAAPVRPPPLVGGRRLMAALALPAGPTIGHLLRLIEEAQMAGEIDDEAGALALARRVLAGDEPEAPD